MDRNAFDKTNMDIWWSQNRIRIKMRIILRPSPDYQSKQMYFGFFHADLTGFYILAVIIVALLVAIVVAIIWRLYTKLPPELTGKSKKDL